MKKCEEAPERLPDAYVRTLFDQLAQTDDLSIANTDDRLLLYIALLLVGDNPTN